MSKPRRRPWNEAAVSFRLICVFSKMFFLWWHLKQDSMEQHCHERMYHKITSMVWTCISCTCATAWTFTYTTVWTRVPLTCTMAWTCVSFIRTMVWILYTCVIRRHVYITCVSQIEHSFSILKLWWIQQLGFTRNMKKNLSCGRDFGLNHWLKRRHFDGVLLFLGMPIEFHAQMLYGTLIVGSLWFMEESMATVAS